MENGWKKWKLTDKHLEDLRSSGLSDETIVASGCYQMSPEEARGRLGFPAGAGLAFPYSHTFRHGDTPYVRLKPDQPHYDDKGKPAKYVSPMKERNPAGNRLYIPPNFPKNALKDASVPLIVTEGEKKTLKANQEGFATVGLSGVTCGVNRIDEKRSKPIADLDLVEWKGRATHIVFDSDGAENVNIAKEEKKLSKELTKRGAEVYVIRIPSAAELRKLGIDHHGKVGLDDFLMAMGPEGLQRLMREAKGRATAERARVQVKAVQRLKSKEISAPEKHREIADLVTGDMLNCGKFFREEIAHYYFYEPEAKTYTVEHEDFKCLVADRYALNPAEPSFKFVVEALRVEAERYGSNDPLRRFAYYDRRSKVHYFSRFDGHMYRLDGENPKLVLNGTEGVFFMDSPEWEPYRYKEGVPKGQLSGLLVEPINFEEGEGVALKPDEQRAMYLIWVYSLFFESILKTKPILLLLGERGSGKTSTLRWVLKALFGDKVEPEVFPSGKEDAFDAVVAVGHLCCFDNVDSQKEWLNDRLAAIATTANITMRKLFTTNEKATYRPRVFLAFTARTPPFRREDVADRLLILRVCRIDKFIPEDEILEEILARRDELWSELLDDANEIVCMLRAGHKAPRTKFRSADWARLALTVAFGVGGKRGEARVARILESMQQDQVEFQLEGNPLIDALDAWVEQEVNSARPVNCGALYSELQEVARGKSFKLYLRSPASLAQQLKASWPVLEKRYTCRKFKGGPGSTMLYSFAPLDSKEETNEERL